MRYRIYLLDEDHGITRLIDPSEYQVDFDSIEDAMKHIDNLPWGEYTVLPIFIPKK